MALQTKVVGADAGRGVCDVHVTQLTSDLRGVGWLACCLCTRIHIIHTIHIMHIMHIIIIYIRQASTVLVVVGSATHKRSHAVPNRGPWPAVCHPLAHQHNRTAC